jgi:tetratricopeptide (TPR) repeat protein
MAIDPRRVVDIGVLAKDKPVVGSGYLVAPGLVLTARHVLEDATSCHVRKVGEERWHPTEIAWLGECDAALLRTTNDELVDPGAGPVALGRIAGRETVLCEGLGFPWAQETVTEGETEHLEGEIDPLSGLETGTLTIDLHGNVPDPRDEEGHSPWEGVSGAAVFSSSLLVGVVVRHAVRFGSGRLVGVSIRQMASEPGFREVLAEAGVELRLSAVEAQGVLSDPYRSLISGASVSAVRSGATSVLLRPEVGVVPFRAREEDLEWLETWWQRAEPGLTVALVHGRGGTGKTRLAAEFCHRVPEDAIAGFLETSARAEALGRLATAADPLLIVIDDAHARTDAVVEALARLTRAGRSAPTTVLLVARQTGDWWDRLLPARLGAAEVELALDTAPARELAPVERTVAGREQAFHDAATAFGRELEVPIGALVSPDLSDPLFEPILFVHLAALNALEGESPVEGEGMRRDLLDFVLNREAHYWQTTAESRGLSHDARVLRRAVATATLTLADTESEAADALAALPDLADARQETLRDVAGWLRDLYPPLIDQPTLDEDPTAVPWFRPLTPDLLADELVARVLEHVPEVVTALLGKATPVQAERVLTVLARAANYPAVDRALRQALTERLSRVWPIALEVAQQADNELGQILAAVLEQSPQPELATDIADRIPYRTVGLRELAVVATCQAYDFLPSRESGAKADATRAHILNHWSNRLADVGDHAQGLEKIRDAVRIHEQLADADPDAFRPALAASLNNLSNRLWDLGDRSGSLAAIERAVEIRRELADARPDAFRAPLAGSLLNLSQRSFQQGDRERALEASEAGLDIWEELVETRRDLFLPNLAAALSNHSNQLVGTGRPEQALPASQKAVDSFRELADTRPDAYLPDLGMALNNLSNCRLEVGDKEGALAAVEEATGINQPLADARPDAFGPLLATSFFTRSLCLSALGANDAALEAIEKALEILEPLAEERPVALRPELAKSHIVLSDCRAVVSQGTEALDAIETAVEISLDLAKAQPAIFMDLLIKSLGTRVDRLTELGLHDQAQKAKEEAVRILQRLGGLPPGLTP